MNIDKKIGIFLGLAIGDALGAPLEFKENKLQNLGDIISAELS